MFTNKYINNYKKKIIDVAREMKKREKVYKKPNGFAYRLTQFAAWILAKRVFKRKVLRNEIKKKKGAFVVIANHQASLDFVNLIGLTNRKMSFVISNSFYNTLPVKNVLDAIGVIPKQQFQTNFVDMKRMKAVVDKGHPLVIYPAGLMTEDGVSTPVPPSTPKFLKWLGVDVYVAKTIGTYFSMPKWTSGMRRGTTYLDVYKLFDGEELKNLDLDEVSKRTSKALYFNAYHEQEKYKVEYKKNNVIEGLENVLYRCPYCDKEFTMTVTDKSTLCCSACGYSETADKYGFLHNSCGFGPEIRYVSDWSDEITQKVKRELESKPEKSLFAHTKIQMINFKKKKFVDVGEGDLTLTKTEFILKGKIKGADADIRIPSLRLPILPFKPGKHIELQQGTTIYRCAFDDGKLAIKFIKMLKAFFEIQNNEYVLAEKRKVAL